jgi:hypothetical protein
MTEPMMRVQARLTARDMTLLGWLADHGVLTSFQIAHALYPSINFAQRRLRTLLAHGVVDRFRPQRPDGGSYPYHYVLAQLGVDVVAAQRGEALPRRDQARLRRWHLTNRANLPHLLGVNDFFTRLAGHERTHPGSALARWWPAARCQQMGAFADPDEDDVRIIAYTPRVRPDGHGVWNEHGATVPFFVEHDTGTERPLRRLVDKLDGYVDLARVTGRIWPVLFWLPSAARERHLHQLLTEGGVRLPVATAARDDAAAVGRSPAEAVWWLHRRDAPLLRLSDLSDVVIDTRERAA